MPEPDLTPYKALPSNIPLERLNPKLADIRDPRQLHWAELSLEEDFDEVDEADEDTLNRILWFAARGRDDTYPSWAIADSDDDKADRRPQHLARCGTCRRPYYSTTWLPACEK